MTDAFRLLRDPAVQAAKLPPSAKLTLVYLVPVLADDKAHPIKVRHTAEYLEIKPRAVRDALRRLVACQLFENTQPARPGVPGLYRLGARAVRAAPRVPRVLQRPQVLAGRTLPNG